MKQTLAVALLGFTCILLMFVGSRTGNAEPKPEAAKGRDLYVVCAACHGFAAEGNSASEAPALAGQQPTYLLRQLHNFASGARGLEGDQQGQRMRAVVEVVHSEEDWRDVVAYIQMLPTNPPPRPHVGHLARGEKLFQSCVPCHGPGGEGNSALGAPRLTNLQDWYIVTQLRNFRAGVPGRAPIDAFGAQMQAASSVLQSAEDIADVAGYISSIEATRRRAP
jgi:cytochrome c553